MAVLEGNLTASAAREADLEAQLAEEVANRINSADSAKDHLSKAVVQIDESILENKQELAAVDANLEGSIEALDGELVELAGIVKDITPEGGKVRLNWRSIPLQPLCARNQMARARADTPLHTC